MVDIVHMKFPGDSTDPVYCVYGLNLSGIRITDDINQVTCPDCKERFYESHSWLINAEVFARLIDIPEMLFHHYKNLCITCTKFIKMREEYRQL